jgi:predicted RNA-binding Zn-ribbon protein involved in translation (DUF1610 family)
MGVLIAALIITAAIVAYVKLERRLNQRPCPDCGFRVAMDGPPEDCPKCGSLIPVRDEAF